MAINPKKITIAGCGPGAEEYITPVARTATENAEVLAGSRRLLDLFPGNRADRIVMTSDVEKFLDEVEKKFEAGQNICVLVSGDPGLCSLAGPALRRFGRTNCRVIAGVSSIQAAFAALGLDWLDAKIVDAHGRAPEGDKSALLAGFDKIAILLGGKKSESWVTDFLTVIGEDTRLFLISDLTLPEETIKEISKVDWPEIKTASRSILLVIKSLLIENPKCKTPNRK